MKGSIEQFYREHLPQGKMRDNVLVAECPFCTGKNGEKKGRIEVFLNQASLFYGYFRCLRSCIPGGYHHWFARMSGIDPASVPGHVEEEPFLAHQSYPDRNINSEVDGFRNKLSGADLPVFRDVGVDITTLAQLRIGYNGRYLVYPYYQIDGNAYSARCVHPENSEDYFWFGDTSFGAGPTGLFNVEEIQRCRDGALFLCEGEENLAIVKQLGFPGVAVHDKAVLEEISPELFAAVKTLFIVVQNTPESFMSARLAASRIGYKVRILPWKSDFPREYTLWKLALENKNELTGKFGEMLVAARPFSPFATPKSECREFFNTVEARAGEEYRALLSGFKRLDERIGGIHGINILGGAPKVGKSSFMTQIATEMARRRVPVLYYDFENGRQRLYQRTFSRLTKIETSRLHPEKLEEEERKRYEALRRNFPKLLQYFRVVNDRKVSPEIMHRHIDFLRHETRSEFTVVVIDSLHKLPFKDIKEMRSGIDAWLRQMEAMRDSLNVAFLVVSELSRGQDGGYGGAPHMGVFKGSGDIEYSADNAMVLLPLWDHMGELRQRHNRLWLVGSREHAPGLVGEYVLDYPYWGFREQAPSDN